MNKWIAVNEAVSWLSTSEPYFVSSADAARLRGDLLTAGFDVRQLDGRDVRDERTLLVQLGRALSFPDYYGQNWDAFIDCVGDLAEMASTPIALVWLKADGLLMVDPHAFVRSVHLLLMAARDIRLSDVGFQLEYFFVGDWGTLR
jgi:RNAse (barnase) inhibitor barstar